MKGTPPSQTGATSVKACAGINLHQHQRLLHNGGETETSQNQTPDSRTYKIETLKGKTPAKNTSEDLQ